MFPLGNVLLPHTLLPLHIFEPRYRALTRDCLAGEPDFGVVLIERGHEVGGGDSRFSVGTVARILQAEELPDGRWVLITVGGGRIRVVRWLREEPYPMGEVEELVDPPPGPDAAALRTETATRLRQVAALRAELGEPGPPLTLALDPDPVRASYEASALASLGPLDCQRLLETDNASQRLRRLLDLLADEAETLAQRLAGA